MDMKPMERKPFYILPSDLLGKEILQDFLEYIQTYSGKIFLIFIFSIASAMFIETFLSFSYPVIIIAVAACSFFPQYRWTITALSTLAVFLVMPLGGNSSLLDIIIAQEKITTPINFTLLRYGMGFILFSFVLRLE